MEYTNFGSTTLRISRVCFGTWQAGGAWGHVDKRLISATIRRALTLGITAFECAHAYGDGEAEELLGETLREELRTHRDRFVISTKGGLRREGSHIVRDASPRALRDDLEASLRALGTEYIDVYLLHWPDPATPYAQTAAALDTFVREGKIRYVGLSNFDAAQMDMFSRRHAIDAMEVPYHLLRTTGEHDILPFAREHDIGVYACSPLAHGLLGGRMTTAWEFADDDWRSQCTSFHGSLFAQNLTLAEHLRALARRHGRTLPQLALAWTLSHPQVDVAVVASHSPDHLTELVGGVEFGLTSEVLDAIGPILAGAGDICAPEPESI